MADDSSDSDYNVEEFVKPDRIRKSVNDDSADLLGNFDDQKRKEILDGTYEEKTIDDNDENDDDDDDDVNDEDNSDQDNKATKKKVKLNGESKDSNADDDDDDDDEDDDEEMNDSSELNTHLTKDQLAVLLRGTSKVNRHVLYVTNLNFETTKDDLENLFSTVGKVKSIRIPKKRRGAYAFVEMCDLESYQKGFELHNTELNGRSIKIQLSEAGKKKSANKKNIIKQKNRKLAEIRNEPKLFTKSGKFYDKAIKKEKAKEMLQRQRWRKKPAMRGGGPSK